jgi:hypothetical protein
MTCLRTSIVTLMRTWIVCAPNVRQPSIRELGGNAEVVPTPGWPVVHGTIDAGAPKTLLIYGMYDVQPVEGEDWLAPPFEGQVVDLPDFGSSVVARGVYNTKGPLAGFFNVVETIRRVKGRLQPHFYDGYPPAKTSVREPAVQALVKTFRELGHEPEIWPHLAGMRLFEKSVASFLYAFAGA